VKPRVPLNSPSSGKVGCDTRSDPDTSNPNTDASEPPQRFVADTGLVAALPLSLSAMPKRKSDRRAMKLDATGRSWKRHFRLDGTLALAYGPPRRSGERAFSTSPPGGALLSHGSGPAGGRPAASYVNLCSR
jgi:hypothetical protein